MQKGETGALKVEGFAAMLPFVVRGKRGGSLHVELELPEDVSVSYRQWMNGRIKADLARAS